MMFMTKNSFGYRNLKFPYIERSVQSSLEDGGNRIRNGGYTTSD